MAEIDPTSPLYPPTVRPSKGVLPLPFFLARFIRNPLRSLPRAVYHEPIVVHGRDRPLVAWVTAPDLIETILLRDAATFAKTRLDKRVLKPVLGNGLLTSDGASWRWQRKLASPLFRHGEILSYVPAMVSAAAEQVERWRQRGPGFTALVDEDMTETTFKVITRTILAGTVEADSDIILRAGRGYLDHITWEIAAAMLLLPEGIWHPFRSRMRAAARDERDAVGRLLTSRRNDTEGKDDLLARMIDARHPDTGEPMPDDLLIDNLATFLLAGHETTAKALTWTLYLMARSPDWQARARREIEAVTGCGPAQPEHISRLEITTRILKEAMRLYPPAPVLTRVTMKPVTLGGRDLPERTLIVIPIYAVHRHHALWTDPDRFDPDRFLPEHETQHQRTQFMPFGFGGRVCIGQAFAMIEAIAILATLLQGATFQWDGKHLPEPVSRVTLRPRGRMPLIVSPIQSGRAASVSNPLK